MSRKIRERLLPAWIEKQVLPHLEQRLEHERLDANLGMGEEGVALLDYPTLYRGTGYVAPVVKLEFGARAMGEPYSIHAIACDAAARLPGLVFPSAMAKVMTAERTFWEKATLLHVFCRNGKMPGGRGFARHCHDLVRLHEAGVANRAIADQALAKQVAGHKGLFFPAKDANAQPVDLLAAVTGDLALVPEGAGPPLYRLPGDERRWPVADWCRGIRQAHGNLPTDPDSSKRRGTNLIILPIPLLH